MDGTKGTRRIAVIGAGASGTLTAAHIARRASRPVIVQLVNDRRPCFRGVAFSTTSEIHLLNVPAGKMSALPNDPGHFFRWLSNREPQRYSPADFVQRKRYGEYLDSTIREAFAGGPARLDVVRDRVVDLYPEGSGVSLTLAGGSRLEADRVVLALGNFLPAAPAIPDPDFYRSAGYVQDPWDIPRLDAVPGDRAVLLVGTGLTMVDIAILLRDRGHRAVIHALSRHGLLPRVHGPGTARIGPLDLDPGRRVSLAELRTRLRQRIREERAAGGDWKPIIDGLRPHTCRLWTGFTEAEKRTFSRHLRPFWDVHRHRIAPQIAERLREAREKGGLEIHRGHITDMSFRDGSCRVSYRTPRGTEALFVDTVVNCTGPASDLEKIPDPLCQALVRRKLVKKGPLGQGIATDDRLAVRDTAGQADDRIYALGPMLKGQLWETTAIPEIRSQAERLAETLLS